MIAIPPWKAEYMEKKRRKDKKDDVPLWKRELLKRIHSKNKKMSEEDKTDIVEEHIPKVSDNIFLVHEKQLSRSASAPQPKTVKPESIPTSPKSSVSADNVIIIEKEKPIEEKVNSIDSSNDTIFAKEDEAEEEYPVAGIVHRLMDRFQRSGSVTSLRKTQLHAPLSQRSKSVEVIDHKNLTEGKEVTIVSVSPPPVSPEILQRTSSTTSDYLAPLLMSTAKPFTRHASAGSGDHGYHHVNTPVRKISSSSLTDVSGPSSTTNYNKSEVEKSLETNKLSEYSSSFSTDLSNLHSNQDVPAGNATQVENIQSVESNKSVDIEKHTSLVNGESLHSSGNVPPLADKNMPRLKPKLHNRTNLTEYGENKIIPKSLPVKSKHDEELVKEKPKFDRSKKPAVMKENIGQAHAVKPTTTSSGKNEFMQEVNESYDESTLKSKAAIAANRIMKSSKTFKITPRNKSTANINHMSTNVKLKPVDSSVKVSSSLERPPVPSARFKIKNDAESETTNHHVEKLIMTKPIPSTSIDDIILDSSDTAPSTTTLVITPVDSLPISETKEPIKQTPMIIEKTSSSVIAPSHTKKTEETISPATFNRKSNVTTIIPKNPQTQPQSNTGIYGPKFANSSPRKSGGRSFVIDPSKFRKSSAAKTQSTNSVNASTVKEAGNIRLIVPQSRSAVPGTGNEVESVPKTGKRKLRVDQIQVIGGYVSLKRSCLVKENTRKKQRASISFCEKDLETTYTYISERSMLNEQPVTNSLTKSPGFAKDGSIGKYTPKYLLSVKSDIPDEEEEKSEEMVKSSNQQEVDMTSSDAGSIDPTPLSDACAIAWSGTTSNSTDILF